MNLRATILLIGLTANFSIAEAQSPPAGDVEAGRFEALNKKLDEVNTKIDALSQQILKVEQQLASGTRPGVMIGEATPAPAAPTAAGTMSDPAKPPAATSPAGNSHVIAKGETLTSIAKMYKVGVEDLQKFNHIENDRKLQVGQTIMIPVGATAPAASPSVAPAP